MARFRQHHQIYNITLVICIGLLIAVLWIWKAPTAPAGPGGLYLAMAQEVISNNYILPQTIEHYTNEGIPFAYPPLAIYFLSFILDNVHNYAIFLRLLPPLIWLSSLIPTYIFADEFFNSHKRATVTAIIFATYPTLFDSYIGYTGIVRAPAYLFLMTGLLTGLKLFTTGKFRWVASSTILFSLTLLTHPPTALFFGISYLTFFISYNRTRLGLVNGIVVAGGGLILTMPWWGTVISTHGIDVYLSAAGSRPGSMWTIISFLTGWDTPLFLPLIRDLAIVGGLVAVARRDLMLPLWTGLSLILVGLPKLVMIPGTFLAVLLIFDVILPTVESNTSNIAWIDTDYSTVAKAFIVVNLLIYSFVSGIGFIFISSDGQQIHQDAALWMENNTSSNIEIYAYASQATIDWIPVLSNRTVVVTPLGTEFSNFSKQTRLYSKTSNCANVRCIYKTLNHASLSFDYLYIQTGYKNYLSIIDSANESSNCILVYKDENSYIYECSGFQPIRG